MCRVTIGHLRVTLGHLKVTVGYFFLFYLTNGQTVAR